MLVGIPVHCNIVSLTFLPKDEQETAGIVEKHRKKNLFLFPGKAVVGISENKPSYPSVVADSVYDYSQRFWC